MKLNMILCLLTASLVLGQSPEELLDKGNQFFDAGDYTNAITQYEEVLKLDPTFAPAMFQLSHCYLRIGDMVKTKEYIDEAIEAEPKNEEYREEFDRINKINTMMNDGNRNMRSGQFEDAYISYELVLEKFPFFAEAAYSMGLAMMRQNDYDEAVKHFRKALELNGQHENARAAITNVAKMSFNDGNKCYKLRDLDCAVEKYMKVVSIDPGFYQAYYQIGVIAAKQGNYDEAIRNYRAALEQNPEFYKGWFAVALVQKRQGKTDEAMKSLQRVVDIHPGYAKAYGTMGEIYYDQKKYDEAASVLQTATQVDPTYDKGYLKLGMVYIELGQYENAVQSLEMATSLNPKKHQAWFLLAQSYNEVGECEKAKNAAMEATDLKRNFGGAWYEMARAEWCDGQGNKTAALNHLEKARKDRSWRRNAEYLMDKIKNPQKYQDN